MTVIEYMGSVNQLSLTRFELCVKEIKQKWDSISIKTKGTGLPEKLWKYFYATVVAKIKNEMFGEQLKAKKEAYEKRKKERERYNDWRPNDFGFYQDMFDSFMGGIFSSIKNNVIPSDSFAILGLVESAGLEDVKSAYKKLAVQHHPDKGGSKEKFVEITEAKNKCLMYVGE